MAEPDRRPIDYIAQTRETYAAQGYQPYRWALNEDPPSWAALGKPLSESRLGLVASGGIYRRGQVAFTHRDDVTHREIPTDVDTSEVRVTHFAFDPAAARRDPNVVFPIDTLRSLVAEGTVGELAPLALTFMGGIYSQRRLASELIPALVDRTLEIGGRCGAAGAGLTGVPPVSWTGQQGDRGQGCAHPVDDQRPLDHQVGQPAAGGVHRLPARPHLRTA